MSSKKITRIGIGGPVGSGKTAIVEAITPRLLDLGIKVLIITNDVVTTEDAKHVQRTLKGVLLEERILGVETGACPHTAVREDPSMNLAAVEDMEAALSGQRCRPDRKRRRQPDTHLFAGAGRLFHLRDRRGGRRQDPAQERARDHAFGHPRHQQDRPRASRRRQPRCDEAGFAADARHQAVPVHQLQDRAMAFRSWSR